MLLLLILFDGYTNVLLVCKQILISFFVLLIDKSHAVFHIFGVIYCLHYLLSQVWLVMRSIVSWVFARNLDLVRQVSFMISRPCPKVSKLEFFLL